MRESSWTQPPNKYPTSDGKPVAETDWHRELLFDSLEILKKHFKDQPMVYVTGNILWYYEPGERRRRISPDVMVCFGVPKGNRQNYLQWEEVCPQVVIEFTSLKTRAEDMGFKMERYETLGVEECYIFDPRQEYLEPRFCAFHRHDGRFVPVAGETVYSNRLGLELLAIGDKLRFRIPNPDGILLTSAERLEREIARRKRESARADHEASLRREAERKLAAMRLLLEEREAGKPH